MAVDFGKYQLLRKIASGGMGQVFLARLAPLHGFHKLLVIKRILPHLIEDEEFFEMFLDEARIVARLNHPNIVQMFELDEVNGAYYLAMEYVPGDDLRRLDRLARKKEQPLPLGVMCRVIADAAAGLDYAHKQLDHEGNPLGLVHRDVSPQNILVGFDGAVKLIDFGVAKAVGRSQNTATGVLKGKYAYMSPEQSLGKDLDHRSDQFALGIVFWEVLTGRRLFKSENDLATMRLVQDCQVPPPSRYYPGLPPELDAIVLRALQKNPKDRYPDTMAFRLAIEDFTVSQGLAASSAHLTAFMKQLYAERIVQESDPAWMDQLAPNTELEPGSGTPAPRSQSAPLASRVGAPGKALSGAVEARATQAAPAPSRSLRLGLWAVLGVVALALGVGLSGWLGAGEGAPPPPEVFPQVTKPTPPPEQAPPTRVTLTLSSEPMGAVVTVDGTELGLTPVEFSFGFPPQTHVAVFTKEGYEPFTGSFSASDAPRFSAKLKKKSGKKPTLDIKVGR